MKMKLTRERGAYENEDGVMVENRRRSAAQKDKPSCTDALGMDSYFSFCRTRSRNNGPRFTLYGDNLLCLNAAMFLGTFITVTYLQDI